MSNPASEESLGVTRRALGMLRRVIVLFNPIRTASSIKEGLTVIWNSRRVTTAMAVREINGRYAGQALGSFWVIGHPLFQMLTYLLIFSVVFRVRIDPSLNMPGDYVTYILSGLVPWLTIQPALSIAPMSVVSNANLVKQFAFKIENIQIKDVMICFVFWLVGMAIVIVYSLIRNGGLPLTILLVPYLAFVTFLLLMGASWFMATIGIFVRDMKDFVTIVTGIGVYLLPIVYLPEWVPNLFKPIIYMNPFSYLIWMYQDVLFFGRFEHPWSWLIGTLFAVLSFSAGIRVFQRLRPMFGNVL